MFSALRDFLLSFCPDGLRRIHRPESPPRVLRCATWGGLAQFFLAALALALRFKDHFTLRAHQWAPQMTGTTEGFQTGVGAIVFFEYLLLPLSMLLLYLAGEGLARFFAGIAVGEPLPNLGVFLAFRAAQFAGDKRIKKERQRAALVPDLMEALPGGRLRISSATARDHWNASLTIGVDGKWFELERAGTGQPPRAFVYLLRPAPEGKVLRGYEEYDAASALRSGSTAPAQK